MAVNAKWRAAIGLFAMFSIFFLDLSYSQDVFAEEVLSAPLSSEDLYYFSEGRKVPLTLAKKLIVRFSTGTSDEEKDEILNTVSALSRRELEANLGIELTLLPTISEEDLLSLVKEINQTDRAEASPVFWVENREAAIDSVVVVPHTPISVVQVEQHIKNIFGNVRILHIASQGQAYRVFFNELFFLSSDAYAFHTLLLANVLQNHPKNLLFKDVYPHFSFLAEPISAEMWVEPLTGTIGEDRRLVLEFTVLDDGVGIIERDLPLFGRGFFVPMYGGSFPLRGFFDAAENYKKEEAQTRFGRLVRYSWKFFLHAPKSEWVVKNISVPYEYKEKEHVLNVKQTTFFVLPHTAINVKIADIPSPQVLVLPQMNIGDNFPEINPPSHWLDSFAEKFGGYENARKFMVLLGLILFGVTALVLGWCTVSFIARRRKSRVSLASKALLQVNSSEILTILQMSNDAEIYKRIGSLVLGLLNRATSHSFHVLTFQVIRDQLTRDDVLKNVFTLEVEELLRSLCERLEMGLAENFTATSAEKEELAKDVLRLAQALARSLA